MVRRTAGRAGGDPPAPKAEAIRHQELEKLFSKLGPLSDSERQAIEAMSSSIINKLLHTPIVRLKQESQAKGGGRYLQALRTCSV
jgi:glutamyl-tRNA reductase